MSELLEISATLKDMFFMITISIWSMALNFERRQI